MINTNNESLESVSRQTFADNIHDNKLSSQLYFLWALLAFSGFSILGACGDNAARVWLLLQVVGICLSFAIIRLHLRTLDKNSLAIANKHILHWSILFIVSTLLSLNQLVTDFGVTQLMNLSLLFCSMSLMSAGLYLDNRCLPAGLVLILCYLYSLAAGPYCGLVSGAVLAGLLVWLSVSQGTDLEPEQ